ncbi:MAG: hypothetical protein ACJARD_001617 [Alphaproteobacteria bacterium]|jgi:hypothetical protein
MCSFDTIFRGYFTVNIENNYKLIYLNKNKYKILLFINLWCYNIKNIQGGLT